MHAAKVDPNIVSAPLEGTEQLHSDISDKKTNSRAYAKEKWKLNYGSDCYNARPSEATLVSKNSETYKTVPALAKKAGKQSNAPTITVSKPVNEAFPEAVNYPKYRLAQK